MTDVVVKLTITGDGTVAVKAVNDVAAASERATGRVRRDSADMAQSWAVSAKGAASLSTEAQRAGRMVAGAFVAIQAAGGVRALASDLIGYADGWSQISARVRLASDDQAQAAATMEQLYASSQRTGTQLDSSVTLYTRLAQSTTDLGLTQQRLLPLAEAINQTFAVSGTGAQAASNAIIQLTQAFAGGILRAEEYNSIIENSPRLAKALADGLGISVGQLRQQVNAGEVSVERMVRALESQVSTIKAEFDQLPLTVGRAWTMLENSVLRYVGIADQGAGASLLIANALLEVAENIDLVLLAIAGLGAAHLASAAQSLIQDQAQRRVAASALAEAEAQVAKLRAQAPLLGSTTALAAAELQLARAQEAATAAGVGKITMLGRLGSGLLSLAGGPVGVAVLAIAGLVAGINAVSKAEDERQRVFKAGVDDITKLTSRINALNEQIERWRQGHGELPDFGQTYATWAQGADELARAQDELNAKRAAIEGIEARIQVAQTSTNEAAGLQLLGLVPKLQKLQDEYKILEAVVTALGAAQGRLDVQVFVDPGQATVASDQSVQALARLTAAAKSAEAQIDKNKQGQLAYWQALAATRIEQARAAGATADQVAVMEREHAALLKTIDAGIKSNSTKASGAKASNDAAKAARDYITDLQKQVATFGQTDAAAARYELGTKKLTAAQREQALGLIAQLEQWEKLTGVVDKAADAWAEFLTGNRSLDEQLAQGRDRLAGLSDAQIDYNASLREANRLAEEALALGPPTVEQQRLLEDRLRKLAELRDQRAAIDAYTEAVDRNRAAAEEWDRAWDQATGDVATVLADFVVGQIKSFSDLGDALLGIVRRTVADMIAEYLKLQIINPLLNQLLGTGLQSGGGVLQGIMSLFGGGAGGGSGGGILSGITQAFSGGGGGLFSAQNWMQAGQSIWSGFFGGAQAAGGLAGITSAATGMYGAGTAVTGLGSFGYAGAAPWMTSTGMVGLGGAGYTGAGAGAATSGAMTSSMAVPIIGWIVAAVMANMSLYSQGWRGDFGSMDLGGRNAVLNGATGGGAWASAAAGELFRGIGLGGELSNLLSGEALWGTLFGRRKPRVSGYTQDFLFGPEGADVAAAVNWRAKGGLFSSDRTGSQAIDVDAAILREVEQFWESVTRSMSSVARRFGAEAPESISASFREEYNKKGELVRSIGTLMGVQYEEAWEVFQQRILAENLIATLGATAIGAGASELAERWRGDAAALLDGARMMIAASDDIRRGAGLLGSKSGLGAVVDLVADLALAGESLVDAYARISEATRLYETALVLTGNTFDGTREQLVRFAVDIAEAAGGIEAASALWNAYFANYYDANTTAALQLDALWTSARQQLGDLGLAPDIDMSGFRAAFEAALPRLTPDQIVTWLQAADALAQATAAQAAYTAAIVEGSLNYIGIVSQLETELGRSSGFAGNLAQIRLWEQSTTRALNDAARAAGRMGASERDLAMVREVAEQRVQQLIAQLRASVVSIRDQLYGGATAAAESWGGTVADQVDTIARATDDLYRRQLAGIQANRDYLDQMLLGDLSALTPQGQLDEAWRQLLEMQQAALGGDADAMAALPQLADVFLRLLRAYTASGADYEHGVNGVGGFWDVRALIEAVAAMSPTVPEPSLGTGTGGSAGTPVTVESFNEALAVNRAELAQQLVGYIADLAAAVQRPVFDLLDEMDISLRSLVDDLGINLRDITAESVRGLAQLAATFGVSLTELTAELGLQLTALGDGVRDLATQMGIDLTAMTVASTQSLADLARQLGVDLGELATAVGIDLGDLASAQSLLNQALAAEIAALPADQRDLLAPLLADISNATTRADANAAIAALEAAVLLLPPDLRDLLAPYLAGVDPATALTQLDYLGTLNDTATAQLDRLDQQLRLLDRVNSNLAAANQFQGLPSYAVGTGFVMGDQIAQIHHAEAVVPAHVNAWLRSAGWQLPSFGGDTRAIEGWLSRIAASCERIVDRLDDAAETISKSVKESSDEAAQRVETAVELAVQNGPRGRD